MAQLPLYDSHGHAQGFLDEEDNFIYLLNGQAIGFVSRKRVFGINSVHLGWIVSGIVFNIYGQRIGFLKNKCPSPPKKTPSLQPKKKFEQKIKKSPAWGMPNFQHALAKQTFHDFLVSGTVPVQD